jgi:hypothetical protein
VDLVVLEITFFFSIMLYSVGQMDSAKMRKVDIFSARTNKFRTHQQRCAKRIAHS